MSEKRFEDRLALITGASRGIGFWVARALAAQGA
ncbi:MAG: oxidoreductase, partial [Alphaproteobacteria bacterium]